MDPGSGRILDDHAVVTRDGTTHHPPWHDNPAVDVVEMNRWWTTGLGNFSLSL